MSKLFTILIFLLAGFTTAFSQNTDSLKRVLPSLQDSFRVDCLNELAINFVFRYKKDSAEYYSALAFEEAKKFNYIKGIAGYFAGKALLKNWFDSDFIQTEVLARQSLQWYNKTPNKEKIGLSYFVLGNALFAQSKFDEAALYLEKAYHASKRDGDETRTFYAYSLLGQVYRESGDYDKAFTYFKEGLQLAQQVNNEKWIAGQFINIGDLYMAIEEYTTALTYYRKAFQVHKKEDINIWDYTIYAELFSLTRQFDSALYYYNWFDSTKNNKQDLRVFYISKGEYFLLRKEYDSALNYFLNGLRYHQESNDRNQIKRALLDIAKTYDALKNNRSAIKYAREGLEIALQTKSKQYIRDAYQTLYSVYDRLSLKDSAYLYYRQYITLKEGVISNQTRAKFSVYNYEQKIELLDKEKQIQEAKLRKESLLKKLLIAGILILILVAAIAISTFIYILFRYRLMQRIKLLEMRSQVSQDLHDEIGASISGINLLSQVATEKLQNNKPAEASEFLGKVKNYSQDVIEKLSDMVWLFNPQNDSIEKLLHRLKYFAISIASSKDATIHFSTAKETEITNLSISQRKAIYLVSKEAINNAVKYAGCMNIYFSLTPKGQGWKLQISDDGKGFLLAENKNGNGLKNMYARADEIGAKFKIQSNPLTGTDIAMEL